MNMLSTFYLIFFIMYLHVLSFFPILQDFAITVVFFNSTITLQENWTKVVSRGLQKHALHLNNLTIAQQESYMSQCCSICDQSFTLSSSSFLISDKPIRSSFQGRLMAGGGKMRRVRGR